MDILWTMIIFFAWVVWIWMMIVILTDVFRRQDIGGWSKAGWVVFMILLPFLGVLCYLIAQHKGMAERQSQEMQQAQQQTDEYIRSVASSHAAEEVAKGKQLLDSGALTAAEFEQLKAQALA